MIYGERMKRLLSTLITLTITSSLVACGGGSKDDSSAPAPAPVVTAPASPTSPVADYTFSDNELGELLAERSLLLEVATSNYAGAAYQEVKFVQELGEDIYLFRLHDNENSYIQLLIDVDKDKCFIYDNTQSFDSFPCDESRVSTSGDLVLIQSVTQSSGASITLELNSELLGDANSIGTTLLITDLQDNNLTIKTSYAFEGLLEELFNREILSKADNFRIGSGLGVTTYLQLRDIVEQHAGANMTFEFDNHINGSLDDDINMYTGLMIHESQMDTLVTANGSVFSGGTDLFAAGKERILMRSSDIEAIELNQQIGVHSWGGEDDDGNSVTALDLPFSDDGHRKQATYFDTVLGEQGIDFYLFTLESAPFDGEYWITQADSENFGFITEIK
jgi:hypothetical protein